MVHLNKYYMVQLKNCYTFNQTQYNIFHHHITKLHNLELFYRRLYLYLLYFCEHDKDFKFGEDYLLRGG